MININNVYQTTLTLLNKEQRGYVTPEEFNYIAGVVQNEVFEGYFQKAAVPDDMDSELSNIGQQYKEKLQPFISIANLAYEVSAGYNPIEINDFYRTLGFHPFYEDTLYPIEADRVNHMEFLNIQLSPLVRPTKLNPTVVVQGEANGLTTEENRLRTYPAFQILPTPVRTEIHYIRTPKDPNWIGTTVSGQIVPNESNVDYQNFELHASDYSEVVARVLGYFGLNVRDPEVQQAAGLMEQKNSAI